jgi:ATP-dependent Clp protease adaptor protein ClpS
MAANDSQTAVLPVAADGTSAVATAVPTKKPARPSRKPKQLPPYKVLLHNDDVNTFVDVIAAILKLTTLEPQEAMLRTLEAHDSGLALLLVTHKERAELYCEQFATFKITVTIEPDAA